jgi:hypothetical protein
VHFSPSGWNIASRAGTGWRGWSADFGMAEAPVPTSELFSFSSSSGIVLRQVMDDPHPLPSRMGAIGRGIHPLFPPPLFPLFWSLPKIFTFPLPPKTQHYPTYHPFDQASAASRQERRSPALGLFRHFSSLPFAEPERSAGGALPYPFEHEIFGR